LTWPARVRRQLGYHTGADTRLYARLSGRGNLELFAELNSLPRKEASHRIADLTGVLRRGEPLDRQVRTLSTGNIHRTFSCALRRTKITRTLTHLQMNAAGECKLNEAKDAHSPPSFF
jgi:ABC-type Na+ transport system ATPase subunit NatA